jgi:hypothetical protein
LDVAYDALASGLPEGAEALPAVPLEVGEGAGVWLDRRTHDAHKRARNAGQSYSETILQLCGFEAVKGPLP